jgi:hypothetical protein
MFDLNIEKAIELKDFHNNYNVKSGFLGYTNIFKLGICSDSLVAEEFKIKIQQFLENLHDKKVHTVLPVIRFETSSGDFHSLTLTDSFKVTNETSSTLLTKKILQLIYSKTIKYNVESEEGEVFLMSRP